CKLKGVLYANIFTRGETLSSAAKVTLEPEGIEKSVHKALKVRNLRERFAAAGKIEYVVVQYQKTKRIAIYFEDYMLYIVMEPSSDYKRVIDKVYGSY